MPASLPPPLPFVPQDFEKIMEFFKTNYKVELTERDMSVKGWNWGTAKFSGKSANISVPLTVFSYTIQTILYSSHEYSNFRPKKE